MRVAIRIQKTDKADIEKIIATSELFQGIFETSYNTLVSLTYKLQALKTNPSIAEFSL